MRFHQNLPRSIVFAPRSLGGIGLCNLSQEQFAQQLIILVCHLRAATTLGCTMESVIRTYQLWAGLREHVLSDMQPCSWIPNAWLSHLRNNMRTLNIQIQYASWTIPPSRHRDRYIMDDLADQNLPKYQLERLNACRMYLQVTTLLEIMDHTGSVLLPHILSSPACPTPQGLEDISSSTLQWPQTHLPSPACWRLWTKTICSIYTGDSHSM